MCCMWDSVDLVVILQQYAVKISLALNTTYKKLTLLLA